MNPQAITLSERLRRIQELDLEPLKFKLVHDHPADWPVTRADEAEREYKRFLALTVLHPAQSLVPAGDIDEFWHCHVLDTALYFAHCQYALGRFLHHFPYSGLMGMSDAEAQRANFAKTCELYFLEFGEPYAPGCDADSCDDCSPDYDCDSTGKVPPLERPRPRLVRPISATV